MSFMNEYDIEQARRWATYEDWRVTLGAVGVIERLATWTNENSDGWAYWLKPSRAARQLVELIERQERASRRGLPDTYDMTYAERDRALRPIKAFLTRHGVEPHVKTWIIDGIEIGEEEA